MRQLLITLYIICCRKAEKSLHLLLHEGRQKDNEIFGCQQIIPIVQAYPGMQTRCRIHANAVTKLCKTHPKVSHIALTRSYVVSMAERFFLFCIENSVFASQMEPAMQS